MLNTLEEIQNNGIVNRFKEIAQSYGLYGIYVNWQPGGLNDGGIYFICGFDSSKITGTDIDMFQILENQRRNHGYICTDITAFKVNGKHPFMLHCDFINHCHLLDALKNAYSHAGVKLPNKISASSAEAIRMTWANFTNSTKDASLRKEYEKMLTYAIKVSDPSVKSKKTKYIENGCYDSERGKLFNWLKRHFLKHKNEVSLPHLITHAGRINSAKILYKNYDKIRQELEKKPEIIYSFSKQRGRILEVADSEGYGSKQDNDRRFFMLYYPFYASKEIEEMIQKINYPTEFNRTLSEIDPYGYGTEHIIIPVQYYDMFKKSCDECGLKFCIDRSSYDTIGGGIAIAFCTADSARAYSFLNGIIETSEDYRLEKPPNNERHIRSQSFETMKQELKNAGFKEISNSRMKDEIEER